MMRYLRLGASLYVPATRDDLEAVGNGEKYQRLRSVIFCTEDAVRGDDVPRALRRLAAALPRLEPSGKVLRFVRVRNPAVLGTVLGMAGAEQLDGFVLPKVGASTLHDYLGRLSEADPFEVMVTLETAEVFDVVRMAALRDLLCREGCRGRVLSLRVGGNDLFNVLGMRRPRGRTVYGTPLAHLIAQLVGIFRPAGFNLAGPVYEYLDRPDVLRREARRDLTYGLFGKAAIHPEQVPVIEACYRVRADELEAAERLLSESAPAVFRHNGAMCEPATHRAWAAAVVERARLYGVTRGPSKNNLRV
jgi:citrate lyase beta subunit